MVKVKIPLFKCRCSAIGKIMTNPQGKTNIEKYNEAVDKLASLETRLTTFKKQDCKSALDIKDNKIPAVKQEIADLELIKDKKELSETCKSFLIDWILEFKYDRIKDFSNKFTEKGNLTEQDGFQLIQDVLFKGSFLSKNTEYRENEYITGMNDIRMPKLIIDNKSSWSLFTFPIGETILPTKDYEYQINGYCDLWNTEQGMICYTLNDTPFHLVDKMFKDFCYKNQIEYDEIPENIAYEIIKNHVFTTEGLKQYKFVLGTYDISGFKEIPKEKRIVHFKIEKHQDKIDAIYQRVRECREWIDENWNNF